MKNMVIHWRRDKDRIRVWRGDWHGDQFDVVTVQEFEVIQAVFRRFSIPLMEDDDSDFPAGRERDASS